MRSRLILIASLLLCGNSPGLGGPDQDLEPYLAPGMKASELRRALSDDLGSGLAGAVPLALLEAAVALEPERFGASVEEGYRRYGFLYLKNRPEAPVGIVPLQKLGITAHQFNCLACHSGPEGSRLIVGAPNPGLDFSGWYRDTFEALRREARAAKPGPGLALRAAARFEAAALRLRRGEGLAAPERLIILAFARRLAEEVNGGGRNTRGIRQDEPYGPGRTVVQAAYRTLRLGMDPGPFAPIKPPDLFGVPYRESLLWTGNETYRPRQGVAERIARNGMLVPWIQLHPLTGKPVPDALTLARFPRYLQMGRFLARAAPPPAPAPANPAEAERFEAGARLFAKSCASCHGEVRFSSELLPDGRPGLRSRPHNYTELLVPAAEVGTDPAYTEMDNPETEDRFDRTLLMRAGLFRARVTRSFVARPLLGLRLRAPYLHNGSVPHLEALLTPPAERPAAFRVGPAVPHDPARVGLAPLPAAGGPERLIRDTRRPGNRATGHPYGTDLAPEQKAALIEFLKRV